VKPIGSEGQAAAVSQTHAAAHASDMVRLKIGRGNSSVELALRALGETVRSLGVTEAVGNEHGGGKSGPLDQLYRSHWRDLCRYVLRNFGAGPPDPEDIAQQAFVRLAGVEGEVGNAGSFLRKTARNLVIDHYRASVRTTNIIADVAILSADRDELSAEDVLSSKEELEVLNGVIAMLPAKERVALLMHRIDGASFTEIATHLGVSHSGARLLVSRAFERCAAAMGET
jgi:RNA polymerase sigma-70 factor (ECF subfamily)